MLDAVQVVDLLAANRSMIHLLNCKENSCEMEPAEEVGVVIDRNRFVGAFRRKIPIKQG